MSVIRCAGALLVTPYKLRIVNNGPTVDSRPPNFRIERHYTRQNIDCSGAVYLIAMSFVTNGSPPANRDSTPPITMPDDNNVRSIGYGVVPCTNMFSTCWQSGRIAA